MKTLPYTQADLETALSDALDAAYEASTEAEDCHFDVRYSKDRGIYIVETEHEDGGEVIASRVQCADPQRTAADLYDELLERASL